MKMINWFKESERVSFLLILGFVCISLADVFREYRSGETLPHLTFEILVSVVASFWGFHVVSKCLNTRNELDRSNHQIMTLNADNERWKKENKKLLDGLSESIDTQLSLWKLSPAEKEVTLLILKGLSFKEISDIRQPSEKTTRLQATTIYQKSSLPGRAELAAFFLEDLMIKA